MLGMEMRLGLTLNIWFHGVAFGGASLTVATSKAVFWAADSCRETAEGTLWRAFTLTTDKQAARIVTGAWRRLCARNIRLDPYHSTFSGGLPRTFFCLTAVLF